MTPPTQTETQPCGVNSSHTWRTSSRHLVHEGVTCRQQWACGRSRITVAGIAEQA